MIWCTNEKSKKDMQNPQEGAFTVASGKLLVDGLWYIDATGKVLLYDKYKRHT